MSESNRLISPLPRECSPTLLKRHNQKLDAPVGIEPTSSPSKGADLPLAEGALGWSGWSSRTSITTSHNWMPEQGSNLHFRIQSRATYQLVDRATAPRLRGDRWDSNPPSPAPQAGASSLSASATPKPWSETGATGRDRTDCLPLTKGLLYRTSYCGILLKKSTGASGGTRTHKAAEF